MKRCTLGLGHLAGVAAVAALQTSTATADRGGPPVSPDAYAHLPAFCRVAGTSRPTPDQDCRDCLTAPQVAALRAIYRITR